MKIAICVPVHGDTKALFTESLAKLLIATTGNGVALDFIMAESSSVAANRSRLVLRAAERKADAILWLDADHTFPPDGLHRLLAHDKPVVGVNYPRRMNAAQSTASRQTNEGYEPVYTTKAKAEAAELEQVASLGLGFCLMRMAALKDIPWPIFDSEMNGSRVKLTEDVYFFRKLEAADVPVFCDHALSWQIGHLATRIVTNADTEALN